MLERRRGRHHLAVDEAAYRLENLLLFGRAGKYGAASYGGWSSFSRWLRPGNTRGGQEYLRRKFLFLSRRKFVTQKVLTACRPSR